MIVVHKQVVLSVDYSDPRNWSIDPAHYFNRNDQIQRSDFPINRNGVVDVRLGIIIPEVFFTTEEALKMIGGAGFRRPNLAETNVYNLRCPADQKVVNLASFCGKICETDGLWHISYVQCDAKGRLNLLRNWKTFRRDPESALLVAQLA